MYFVPPSLNVRVYCFLCVCVFLHPLLILASRSPQAGVRSFGLGIERLQLFPREEGTLLREHGEFHPEALVRHSVKPCQLRVLHVVGKETGKVSEPPAEENDEKDPSKRQSSAASSADRTPRLVLERGLVRALIDALHLEIGGGGLDLGKAALAMINFEEKKANEQQIMQSMQALVKQHLQKEETQD